ncbi:hypothetical protein SAMN04488243_13416 [Thermus arciformis]|uniref:SD-repeat containing protein B domain-containing protein n=1 Tax=Thermus arciformis TaxID=482827 RepID=A0A1G7JGC1_9DEIN|nr:hypothetical protein [Thermus arciformis]SDF23961.1 hypothetical protein SAMN04488243_13416 [Thermus arciformis]
MRTLLPFLLGVALALEAPEGLEAKRGGFLSIPVRGEGTVAAEAPEAFLPLTGQVEGEGLLNFLVRPEARAGEYVVRVRDARTSREVRVRVLPEAGLRLKVPPGATGVEGETLTYTLFLENTGNAPDRVRLEVRTLLPYRLEGALVDLEPGETREIPLELKLTGRNRDTATVLAYSSLDPSVRAYGVVETTILPFAGAESLGRNALRYRFGLRLAYGEGKLGYAVALGLSGSLSDYVGLASGLEWSQEGVKGEASLRGEGFALGFRGYGDYLRLEGEWGPLQAYYAFGGVAPTLGALYQEGPARLALTLSASAQRLDLGYALREGGLTLTPYLALRRRASPEEVRAGGGLEARLEDRAFSLAGRLEYLGGMAFRLGGATRSQEPYGLKGEVAYQGGVWQGSLEGGATLTEEVRASLSVRAGQGVGGRFGLTFRPLTLPLSLQAGLGYQGGVTADLGLRVRLDGLEFGGGLASQPTGSSATLYLGYRERDFSVRTALNLTPSGRTLLLAGEARFEDLEGSLQLGYDLDQGFPEAQGALLYRLPEGFGLGLAARYRQGDLSWQALGVLELKGGFNTPEEVVQAFGGRATGYVEGVVFHDRNRDGVRNLDEPPLPGARVRVGALEAVADGNGRYRLELYPGSYRLEVGGLEATLALRRNVEARVERGRALPLDLPMETVVGLQGQVYLDENRNGQRDEGEPPLPYARVFLRGPEARTAFADGRGNFTVGGLLPGRYTLSLDPKSLGSLQEPGEPLVLELAPGPFPQAVLAARPVVREVVQTLTEESLGLVLRPLPPALPPGAELPLWVEVQGKPERVVAEVGGQTYPLEPAGEGLYGAYLPVAGEGGLEIRVRAFRGSEEAEVSAFLPLRPGPLATLTATPALLDPGEEVRLEARLLRRASRVEVRLGPLILPLERVDDLTYRGSLPAPKTPGAYTLELYLDGTLVHTARIRVRD